MLETLCRQLPDNGRLLRVVYAKSIRSHASVRLDDDFGDLLRNAGKSARASRCSRFVAPARLHSSRSFCLSAEVRSAETGDWNFALVCDALIARAAACRNA